MRPPTLRDVAQQAGVHPATASRALNPETRGLVNEDTASRVMKVAKQLGYRPNPIARSLKTARSATIGLLVPDLTNPLFPPIVRGVEQVLSPVGYSAWIVNTDNDLDREKSQVQSLRSRQVEGFIIATARLQHPLLEQLHSEGVPVVLVNRRLADGNVPSVTPDDAAGAAMAVSHLTDLGHTRIAHLAGPQDTSTGVARLRAYREALGAHGIAEDPDLVVTCSAWTETEGARGLRELLDSGIEFTAVLGGNDLLALGCYDVLEERGLRCPDDLSVIGFNDVPFVDKLRPPLTSIHVPHQEMGAEAAHLLLDLLQNPGRHPRSVLLPPSIAVRQSTAPPRARAVPRSS